MPGKYHRNITFVEKTLDTSSLVIEHSELDCGDIRVDIINGGYSTTSPV